MSRKQGTMKQRVLALSAKGKTPTQIATKLRIGKATVYYHLKSAAKTDKKATPKATTTTAPTDAFAHDETMALDMLSQADRLISEAMQMQSEAYEALGRTHYLRSKAPDSLKVQF